MIEAWHGTNKHFKQFDQLFIGSGEGDSHGYGFYFARKRSNGEYFAKYLAFREPPAFLYRTGLHLDENDILPLNIRFDDLPEAVRIKLEDRASFQFYSWGKSNGHGFHSAYQRLRDVHGNHDAACLLLEWGFQAVSDFIEPESKGGETIVALDRRVIDIQEIYQWQQDDERGGIYDWIKLQ